MKKNNKCTGEMVISFIIFMLTIPLILIITMFGNGCNFRIWLLIIYFIPNILYMMLDSIFPNPFFHTNLGLGLCYSGIQLIINTILLGRLIYLLVKGNYKEKYYLVSIVLVILNYIMIFYFLNVYIHASGCNF